MTHILLKTEGELKSMITSQKRIQFKKIKVLKLNLPMCTI